MMKSMIALVLNILLRTLKDKSKKDHKVNGIENLTK